MRRWPAASPKARRRLQAQHRAERDCPSWAWRPGSVHLTPHLAFDGRLWSLRLDAEGPQGTYVVRDLEALAHRVQRGEYFSYGKKLAFAHRLEAFDGPSRAVARTLA